MSETTGPPPRHRADDDVEALASGAFTPVVSSPPPTPNPNNGITDLLPGNGDGDVGRVGNGRTDVIRVDRTTSDISDSDEEHPLSAADVLLGATESTLDDDEDIDENEPLELDYESDDDDDDLSVGSAVEGAAELSKRTSDLMDDFRNYVGEMASPSEEETAVGDVEKGSLFTSKKDGDEPLLMNTNLDFYGGGGLRDFGGNPTFSEEGEDYISQEYGSPRGRNIVSYKYAWLRSKRVQKAFCMIAITSVIIAIVASVTKARHDSKLPDWNKELDEILADEDHEAKMDGHVNSDGNIMAVPSEPLQKHPESTTSTASSSTEPTLSGAQNILSGVLTVAEQQSHDSAFTMVQHKYDPTWYDRTKWTGTSYEQALVFCAEQDMRVPCPYEAICPKGPNNAPFGGYKDGIDPQDSGALEQWSPVIDDENGWVQVSSDDNNGCMVYNFLHPNSPEWGEQKGGNEEQTRHILCCRSTAPEVYDPDGGDQPPSENASSSDAAEEWPDDNNMLDEDVEPVMGTPDDEEEEDLTSSPIVSDRPVDESQSLINPETILNDLLNQPLDEKVIAAEYAEAASYDPQWYDRDTGWTGQTYNEGVDFCESIPNYELCPYEVYCPTGPRHIPYGGMVDDPNGSWSPLGDYFNDFVQLGANGMCLTYVNLHLMPPVWGTTGEENEEITRHVLCCKKKGEQAQDETEDAVSTSETAPEEVANGAQMAESDEEKAEAELMAKSYMEAEKYEPVLYDRESGWQGNTYSEAESFCKMKGPTHQLCPYEVYCPLGTNSKPYGGGVTVEGTNSINIWAPTSDSANNWVQIHKTSDDVCVPYMNTHLSQPTWGTSRKDDDTDFRGFLMCCRFPDAVANGEEEQQQTEEVEEDVVPVSPYSPLPDGVTPEMYEPAWYERRTGWHGATYQEAVDFCASTGHTLCPYQVYCLGGPRSIPYSGGIAELGDHEDREHIMSRDEQWAPILNEENSWVQVGKELEGDICYTYTMLNGEKPSWGSSKEGEHTITGYLMCCHIPDSLSDITEMARVTATPTAKPKTAEPTMQPTPQPSSTPTPQPVTPQPVTPQPVTAQPVTAQPVTPQPVTPRPTPLPTNKGNIYEDVANGFRPIWFDRSSGWTGQTYKEGIDFCKSLTNAKGEGMMMCPMEAYCPLGEGTMPYGGMKVEPNGSWAPIMNNNNYWVQLGDENKCMLYTTLYPDTPAWGVTGQNNEQMTRHILCCSIFDSSLNDEGNASKPTLPVMSPTSPAQAAAPSSEQFSEREKAIEAIYTWMDKEKFKPVGFDRYQGWTGQTYTEAAEFCSSKNSMIPCSYEALCPKGDGGHPGPLNGPEEIWMSIVDSIDAWVELRDGYCEKHTTLHPYQDVTKYLMCCAKPKDHEDIPFNIVPGSSESASAPAPVPQISPEDLNQIYKNSDDRFKPVSYDRSMGWTGRTYGDALLFCASKNSKIPCPYEAICPTGPDGRPIGGEKDGPNGVFAPIMDTQNGWLSIGYKDTCVRYNDMKPHPPMWGLTGNDNEAITRHIKCCDEVEGARPYDYGTADIELEPMKLTKPEEIILDTTHPIWFSRKEGYHGTTHEEAELFCKSVGDMHLCPIEAYCPNGPQNEKVLFLQHNAFDGEQWAPISKYDNEDIDNGNNWIMVGKKDGDPSSTCQQYEQLYGGKSPPWTADGSKTELKENILCCSKQEALKHEQDIARGMNPIWMDSSHGWTGGSYNDGEEFCAGLGGKTLCPYAAYCPHGPGSNPMGGHSVDFNLEGEQWAPVYGKDNDWLLVGRKHENSATTCYSHIQLEGMPPDWGYSNDNAKAKKYIQCCSF